MASADACLRQGHAVSNWCDVTWHNATGVCELRDARPDDSSSSTGSRTLDEFNSCVRARRVNRADYDAPMRGGSRGVAIVESMTANFFNAAGMPIKEEIHRTTHNIRCWAKRHNYTLILNSVPIEELRKGYSKPYGPRRLWSGVPFDKINDVRHRAVARYLDEGYEHVLHIDTDTIAIGEGRSLEPFLRHPAAMQFQMRETGEIAAATYIARRSHETSCFLTLVLLAAHAAHPRTHMRVAQWVAHAGVLACTRECRCDTL